MKSTRKGEELRGINKATFICKTDLNTDGRVLNQLEILTKGIHSLEVDFILLPDKKVEIDLPKNVRLHSIKCLTRNSRILRAFTVCEWTIKATRKLLRLKPYILHVQDSEVILPVLLYLIFGGRPYLIYDDHELPNENDPLLKKLWNRLELFLMRRANTIIFANQERLEYMRTRYNLRNELLFFLNLPYNSTRPPSTSTFIRDNIQSDLDAELKIGTKFIMHQGPLRVERGRELIAQISNKLPTDYKILLIGGTNEDFNSFCREFDVNANRFYFIGTVPYNALSYYWEKAVASIVIYLPKYINNRLCAPNRLYLSYFLNVPLIVNRNNPVLQRFVKNYEAGLFIDEINTQNLSCIFDSLRQKLNEAKHDEKQKVLKGQEVNKLISLYHNILWQSAGYRESSNKGIHRQRKRTL